ncbi:acyl carrier protein [Vibrio cincinnatiensis]|uniref:acyl carrier protein n=1 Tax=Vibrio cincinnatiensis TaxID=675 RepID=UPI0012ACFE45|nr:acyl carrier protein [Vibrio cincinnatiensis]MCG3724191.1 acyl carrier protein [Vibrio cincinnatiensis]MCG3734849.1 acyl carrier protein [Vibrio cincinnatiensis]MCG3742187.1 acyl carrier protein [Vibrio cincinnatiensis]MCG3758720.1 acyl carrier protein [Vibrio cincinnatiensis]MCG3762026.1 acyl carrier protein [Vibrio cincinnatiensis]
MVDAKQLVISEVTQALKLSSHSFSFDTNLYQLGLHSLLILRLSECFSAQCGVYIGYLPLASQPTLNCWIALVDSALQSSSLINPPEPFCVQGSTIRNDS